MTQMDQTGYMPIFGSDLPEYVKDPKHCEALEEIKRIVLGARKPRRSGVLKRMIGLIINSSSTGLLIN